MFSYHPYCRQKTKAAVFILIILCTTIAYVGSPWAVENSFPFYPEEKMIFRVKWAFIPAGEAVLEVGPMEVMNSIRSYHFVLSTRTYEYFDLFYKVRDRIESYTNAEMTHSILYKKRHQGRSQSDVVVHFDWDRAQAQYSDFGKKIAPISLMPGAFDPLSVFFAFRLHDMKGDGEIQTPVTDGKKCIIGKAKIIKKEKIKVPTGTYDTYLVEPDLEHIKGVFKKSKNAKLKIWVTADHQRIPVRIKSKVRIGTFVAELISYERGRSLKDE